MLEEEATQQWAFQTLCSVDAAMEYMEKRVVSLGNHSQKLQKKGGGLYAKVKNKNGRYGEARSVTRQPFRNKKKNVNRKNRNVYFLLSLGKHSQKRAS